MNQNQKVKKNMIKIYHYFVLNEFLARDSIHILKIKHDWQKTSTDFGVKLRVWSASV